MEAPVSNMNYVLLGVLVAANVPVYWLLFKALFRDSEELIQAIVFWITPDLFSLFRGQFMEDWWAEMKLSAFVFLASGAVWFEYIGIAPYLS